MKLIFEHKLFIVANLIILVIIIFNITSFMHGYSKIENYNKAVSSNNTVTVTVDEIKFKETDKYSKYRKYSKYYDRYIIYGSYTLNDKLYKHKYITQLLEKPETIEVGSELYFYASLNEPSEIYLVEVNILDVMLPVFIGSAVLLAYLIFLWIVYGWLYLDIYDEIVKKKTED